MRRATTVGEERRSGTIALFALGFRPFFLAAGLTGVLLAAVWVAVLGGLVDSPAYYDAAGGALAWHAHEMLFGYVAAVVAGFLLTSVRNWTGIDTPTGAKLGALLALWIAGRVAPFLSEGPAQAWIALLDLAFLPALMVVLAVPLVRRAQPRNFVFVGVLGVLTLANLLVHLQALGITWTSARTGNQLAVDGIVLLMTLIAGRVVPFFVGRALEASQPRTWRAVEVLSVGSVVALAILRPFTPDPLPLVWVRCVAAVAAAAHASRLWGWYDRRIWSRPLLWVLFLGYAWLVVGFALTALSLVLPLGLLVALHAFTTGGIGSMTLGMMARIALGHTGRPLVAPRSVAVGFGAISLAAAARVLLPLLAPQWYAPLLTLAAGLWIVAFLPFLARYAGILVRPRADGRPG